MEFRHINIWYHKWNISKISTKDEKKINNTFQHKFSILRGSIADSLLSEYIDYKRGELLEIQSVLTEIPVR